MWIRVLCLLLMGAVPVAAHGERLRLIVETDAGGDPDDEQSLVRFLLYVNEWDVEGIIANRPRARWREPKRAADGARDRPRAFGGVRRGV